MNKTKKIRSLIEESHSVTDKEVKLATKKDIKDQHPVRKISLILIKIKMKFRIQQNFSKYRRKECI